MFVYQLMFVYAYQRFFLVVELRLVQLLLPPRYVEVRSGNENRTSEEDEVEDLQVVVVESMERYRLDFVAFVANGAVFVVSPVVGSQFLFAGKE